MKALLSPFLRIPSFHYCIKKVVKTLWRRKDCRSEERAKTSEYSGLGLVQILLWNSIFRLTGFLGLLNYFHSHRNRSQTTFSIVMFLAGGDAVNEIYTLQRGNFDDVLKKPTNTKGI